MRRQIDLKALADADIQAIDKEELADVSGLVLDPELPQELRAGCILEAAGNPYCFRVGGLGVKLEFMDSGPPLQEAISSFLQRKNCFCSKNPL